VLVDVVLLEAEVVALLELVTPPAPVVDPSEPPEPSEPPSPVVS